MYDFGRNTAALRAWVAYGTALQGMSLAAGEVIFRRSLMLAQGSMSGPDALGMVLEKASTFVLSAEKAAVAASRGADPARIAAAALRPYGSRTKANVRKLRR